MAVRESKREQLPGGCLTAVLAMMVGDDGEKREGKLSDEGYVARVGVAAADAWMLGGRATLCRRRSSE